MLERLNRTLQPVGLSVTARLNRKPLILEDSYQAVVTGIFQETSRAVTVEFELLEGYRLNFRSGQYVTVSLPAGSTFFQRNFAFSSASHENRYTLTVQSIFRGRVSDYFRRSLSVGDTLYVEDPAGDFVLPADHPEKQRYVMIAGGSGIVPIFSLVKDLLGRDASADIQLVYAARNREQAVFARQLERLAADHPGLSVHFQYTRRLGGGHDPARRLDGEKILSRLSDPASALFYLCAPYGLVKKCSEAFSQAGIPSSRILIENYHSVPDSLLSQHLKPRAITFLSGPMALKPNHFRQREVSTLLDSAHQAGMAIPQQCTVGNCHTCKVKVQSGTVLMDEPNTLSVEEARQGYVLSCVSYPCDPLVVKLPG